MRWLNARNDPRARTRVPESSIKVHAIRASKGLQYRAVILLWMGDLPFVSPANKVARVPQFHGRSFPTTLMLLPDQRRANKTIFCPAFLADDQQEINLPAEMVARHDLRCFGSWVETVAKSDRPQKSHGNNTWFASRIALDGGMTATA